MAQPIEPAFGVPLSPEEFDRAVREGPYLFAVYVDTSQGKETVFLDTSLQQLLYDPKYPLDIKDPKSNLSAVWRSVRALTDPSVPSQDSVARGPYTIYNAVVTSPNIKLALDDSTNSLEATSTAGIPKPDYGVVVKNTQKPFLFYVLKRSLRSNLAIYTLDDNNQQVYLFPSKVRVRPPPPEPRSNVISGSLNTPQYVFTLEKIAKDTGK